MAKALRDVDAAMVLGAELHGNVLHERRGLGPQVHDDVEDGAAAAACRLGLCSRRKLKVHCANGALLPVETDVRLRDLRLEAMSRELVLTERAGEEPAAVVPAFEVDDERSLERGFRKDHRRQILRALVGIKVSA